MPALDRSSWGRGRAVDTRDGSRCALRGRRPWRGQVTGLDTGRPARADGELVKVQSGGLVVLARSSMRKAGDDRSRCSTSSCVPVAVDPPESHDRGPPVARGSRPRRPTAHLAPVVPATYPNRTLASSEAEVCSIDAARASFRALRVGARRSRDEPGRPASAFRGGCRNKPGTLCATHNRRLR
jgi:hypothetical protein